MLTPLWKNGCLLTTLTENTFVLRTYLPLWEIHYA